MERPSLTEYYLDMLELVASRSTCIRRRVGAIITDAKGHVLSTGYNGVPKNFDHCISHPCTGATDLPGNNTNCLAVHAEQNALLQCMDIERAHTMYCSCIPCFICAKMIANTNIELIVAVEEYADTRGKDILIEAGIVIHVGETVYGMEDQ